MEFVVIAALGAVYLLLAGLLSGDLRAFLRNELRLMCEREWSDGIYDSSENPRPCGRLDPRCQATLKALNADPEFAKANAERAAERMRKLNADPEFTARRIAALREAKRNARGGAQSAQINRSRNGKRG